MIIPLLCPSCAVQPVVEQGLTSAGYTVHFFAGGTFFLGAACFLLWAWKSGQFRNAEETSRRMFEQELAAEFPRLEVTDETESYE